jgi:hypothetical protein
MIIHFEFDRAIFTIEATAHFLNNVKKTIEIAIY